VDGLFLYFFWTYEGKRCLKKKCNVSNYTRQQQDINDYVVAGGYNHQENKSVGVYM
jgi:hypothetical protein